MSRKRVVVVGGTGYLGQHLLQVLTLPDTLTTSYDLAFTFHSTPPHQLLQAIPHSLSFLVDLSTGDGFDSILRSFGQPDVVINCAAISVPRACEADPAAAMSINVPSSLVKWLSGFKDKNTLLIHLSTDQGIYSRNTKKTIMEMLEPMTHNAKLLKKLYEGSKSFYKEDDEAIPVNVYGSSKVEAEKFISTSWSNFAILRSSIIIGTQTLAPIPKSLPIQWIDSVLSKGNKADFFYDEFRCPVFVKDVVAVILALTERWISAGQQMQLLLNLGGPDRLSRVQMAETVADIRGYDSSLINLVSAASVDRGVKSPSDISMDTSKLVETLGFSLTPYKEAVKWILEYEGSS